MFLRGVPHPQKVKIDTLNFSLSGNTGPMCLIRYVKKIALCLHWHSWAIVTINAAATASLQWSTATRLHPRLTVNLIDQLHVEHRVGCTTGHLTHTHVLCMTLDCASK